MQMFRLLPHPHAAPRRVRGISVGLVLAVEGVLLTYRVDGAEHVAFPPIAQPGRADDLWKTTCFELFLKPENEPGYIEFNFSPSGLWAAYAFGAYRESRRPLLVGVPPIIAIEKDAPSAWKVDCDLGGTPPAPLAIGLSAVIEEQDGTKSYWALAHPPGAPDFHNPACFIATLPAPVGR